jgi:drug/metabolite transporter (DMT)-like permease
VVFSSLSAWSGRFELKPISPLPCPAPTPRFIAALEGNVSHLAFLLICVTWGASFILMERATHAFGPVGVGIGRLLGGAAVLAGVWWVQRGRHRVSWGDVVRIAGVALVGTSWPFVVQPYCLAQGFGHSYFGMMVALVPLATIVVSVPMLGVWPTARQLVGVVGGFVCMLVLLQDGAARGMSTWLLALGLTTPLSYALGNTYLKWKLSHVHSVPLTTLVLVTAAAWLVPLELIPGALSALDLSGPSQPDQVAMAVASLALLGMVGTGVAVLAFIHLVVKEGPLFAGMVTYVVPVFALMWGAFDGETITLRQLVAIGGVLGMVALVQLGGAGNVKLEAGEEREEPHFCPSENPADAPLVGQEMSSRHE